ncbi:MAG: deoxyribodipyrimidine photo-lyase [Alphaproteobacteria bacterium]
MGDKTPIVHWFREDLRLDDNAGLAEAVATGRPLIALYVLEEVEDWPLGGASTWWLHHTLASLSDRLVKHGVPLILRKGKAGQIIPDLLKQAGAQHISWTRRYGPAAVERDKALKSDLTEQGIEVLSAKGTVLFEPFEIKTKQGNPYGVFTPFWKAMQAAIREGALPAAIEAPDSMTAPAAELSEKLASDSLGDWQLLPTKPDWAGGLRDSWTPGEAGAQDRLTEFLDTALKGYADNRNIPGTVGTSRLSPHLHHGEISPRRIWHVVQDHISANPDHESDAMVFLSEIAWREFSIQLLFHNADLPEKPLKRKFTAYPWASDYQQALQRWQKGQTGYPIVDAGMRELWHTGWMHNRVRMIVGSFLVKHLRIPWQEGEAWFWDTLVDADLASNSASWQWIAGCGADAAPYFRVFNPITQSEKFDPKGAYIRRWVPELKDLPDKLVHFPADAEDMLLRAAGVRLGSTYPRPIVNHAEARKAALAGYKKVKEAADA